MNTFIFIPEMQPIFCFWAKYSANREEYKMNTLLFCFAILNSVQLLNYSVLILLTGLTIAALTAITLTVNSVITMVINAAAANINHERDIR